MASKKYNPDDVERWVTVRGARIPIMKDGSFGVGTKDNDEERAMNLVDSKDYVGDEGLKKGVKDSLKSSGYDLGSRMTVDSVEISRWDGKSDYGYVNATYTLYGGNYGKNGQEFTEELRVPVRKSSTTSRNARYDTSRANTDDFSTAKSSYHSTFDRDVQNMEYHLTKGLEIAEKHGNSVDWYKGVYKATIDNFKDSRRSAKEHGDNAGYKAYGELIKKYDTQYKANLDKLNSNLNVSAKKTNAPQFEQGTDKKGAKTWSIASGGHGATIVEDMNYIPGRSSYGKYTIKLPGNGFLYAKTLAEAKKKAKEYLGI